MLENPKTYSATAWSVKTSANAAERLKEMSKIAYAEKKPTGTSVLKAGDNGQSAGKLTFDMESDLQRV